MPIVNIQLQAQGQTPDGQTINVPPSAALTARGPVVQATFGLADVVAQEWVKRQMALPGTHSGLALIDTGASTSCIDDQIAQQLGMPIVDVARMTSATHQDHPSNIYPVKMEISGLPIKIDIPKAMGANIQAQGIVMLIGRDFLAHCILIYNGGAGQFTICI